MSENKRKYTLHVIPHSHWDREWYQPFETHRIKLVELFDAIIEEMEKDPNYTFYHFDGQFVPVEDYLEIRPEMRERLYKLIREDRIQVGPWYVLQDEYLTSGEANVRNMLYGIKLCKQIGAKPVMTGYFPDSFGNVSQAPQICAGFGIDNAVFGRGLNDIATDNQVVQQNGITNSELIWRSPDGSEVIGVMFANWYNNAMELPSQPDALKERIHNMVGSLKRFATTDQLLGMNGCDHQPLQRDLVQVIKLANEVQDEVYVKQSNFKDYIEEIRKNRENLATFEGEIAGQYTWGWYLLTNTASTHIDIKQKNHAGQHQLERLAEPANALSTLFGREYPADFFLYAWRKLMQNHPHDSICTCSCDEVYEEMLTRFAKSKVVADKLTDQAMEFFAGAIDTTGGDRAIVVLGLDGVKTKVVVKCNVDFEKDRGVTAITVYDKEGNVVPACTKLIKNQFKYTLPSDRFRQPEYVDRFEVEMLVETSGIGYDVYTVKIGETACANAVSAVNNTLENDIIKVTVNSDGSFDMLDKRSGQLFTSMNRIIDEEDLGESYNFRAGNRENYCITDGVITEGKKTPYSASYKVEGKLGPDMDVVTTVTLTAGIDRADVTTKIVNRGENHRVRALFNSEVKTETVLAEGQFDLVRRNIEPNFTWTNPSNDQKMQAFAALESDQRSLSVAGRGLYEYEVYRDGKNTLALTLLRCVWHMGDWGVFPTPLAQCKGEFTLEYSVIPYAGCADADAYTSAYTFSYPAVLAIGCPAKKGDLPASASFLSIDNKFIRMSALKKAEDSDSLILRVFNISEKAQNCTLTVGNNFSGAYLCGMDEIRRSELCVKDGKIELEVPKKKIYTIELCR